MNAYKIKSADYKKYEEQFRKTFIGRGVTLLIKTILYSSLLPLVYTIYDDIYEGGSHFAIIMAFFWIIILLAFVATIQYLNMVLGYINSKKEE